MIRSNGKRNIPRYSLNPAVQKFYEQHYGDEGPVTIGNHDYFADGASLERSQYGMLSPPPDDLWERAKNIESYWAVHAERAIAAFDEFSNYLLGYGSAPAHVAHASKDKKLEYLESLRDKAQTAKRKLRKAKQQVTQEQPAWLTAREREDVRRKESDAEFQSKVQSIRL